MLVRVPEEQIWLELILPIYSLQFFNYRKVASSNTSGLEAHTGFFRLLMKEIFDPYVL